MTIQIGRAGRDNALTLRSPASWSMNGDQVDVNGTLDASSLGALLVLRSQVTGLAANPDEPVVPVNWTGDPSIDGYYEVLSSEVPMPARGLAARRLTYHVSLRRVGTYPDINSVMVGNDVMVNAHGVAKGTTVPWWGVPDDATMDYVPSASATTRVSETGTVNVWYRTDGGVLYNRTNRWQCLASDYYDGACRVEITPDGVTWAATSGRRLPATAVLGGWRLNNGLVRVSYGGGDGLLTVEHYVAGAWSVSKTYKLTVGTGPTTLGTFRTITVVRNSPAAATVRICLDQDNATTPAAVTVDLTVRRGGLWVDGMISRTSEVVDYLGLGLGIYRNTTTGSQAHTAGVHQTTADVSGGRGKYLLNTAQAKTNDLTQGGFRLSSAEDRMDFQIGYEPGSAAAVDNFTNQTYAWLACLDETVGFSKR